MNQGSSHAKSSRQKEQAAHSSKDIKHMAGLQNKAARVARVGTVRREVEGDELLKLRKGK